MSNFIFNFIVIFSLTTIVEILAGENINRNTLIQNLIISFIGNLIFRILLQINKTK